MVAVKTRALCYTDILPRMYIFKTPLLCACKQRWCRNYALSRFRSARSFTLRNTLLPTSYELIMIAQAGAIFRVRGTQPLHNPERPSVLKMCHKNLGIDLSSGARILLTPSTDGLVSLKTCRLVFPTSKGIVNTEATAPDPAPAMKLSVNVVV